MDVVSLSIQEKKRYEKLGIRRRTTTSRSAGCKSLLSLFWQYWKCHTRKDNKFRGFGSERSKKSKWCHKSSLWTPAYIMVLGMNFPLRTWKTMLEFLWCGSNAMLPFSRSIQSQPASKSVQIPNIPNLSFFNVRSWPSHPSP